MNRCHVISHTVHMWVCDVIREGKSEMRLVKREMVMSQLSGVIQGVDLARGKKRMNTPF